MEINLPLSVIFIILVSHFIADFIIQTDYQAKNKYKGGMALIDHVNSYSIFMGLSSLLYLSFEHAWVFAGITIITHYLIDLVSSNVGKIFWKKGDTRQGFMVVGFDQLLHYIQLFLTASWLLNR